MMLNGNAVRRPLPPPPAVPVQPANGNAAALNAAVVANQGAIAENRGRVDVAFAGVNEIRRQLADRDAAQPAVAEEPVDPAIAVQLALLERALAQNIDLRADVNRLQQNQWTILQAVGTGTASVCLGLFAFFGVLYAQHKYAESRKEEAEKK